MNILGKSFPSGRRDCFKQALTKSGKDAQLRDCPSMIVYLSLGSNVGDRIANLRAAIAALAGAGACVTRVSQFYETEPVDYLQQAWFLNCVVEAETALLPAELLRQLRAIEACM